MATIRQEIEIDRSTEFVWDVIRDVGADSPATGAGIRSGLPTRRRLANSHLRKWIGCP